MIRIPVSRLQEIIDGLPKKHSFKHQEGLIVTIKSRDGKGVIPITGKTMDEGDLCFSWDEHKKEFVFLFNPIV